jgi:hypothetical protein
MSISFSRYSSVSISLTAAAFLSLFLALILSFAIPPILNLFPSVVLWAQNLVCPAGYHLDPFSLWSSLCTDGNFNYISVWWLYSGVSWLSFFGSFLIGTTILFFLINRPPLSRSQFDRIKELLQCGNQQQALQWLEHDKKLKPYQAEVFIRTLQNNPNKTDLLRYAWHQALDASDPTKPKSMRKLGTTASRSWLPGECPHCGAALDPTGVTWVNTKTAKCPFCEGVVKEHTPG